MKNTPIHPLPKKEAGYINFFHYFIIFLTKTFSFLLIDNSLPEKIRKQLEFNFITSVSLVWTMHVSIYFKKSLLFKVPNETKPLYIFNEDQSRVIIPLFQQLKKDVKRYSFLNDNGKIQCLNKLDQILHYYESSSYPENLFNNDPKSVFIERSSRNKQRKLNIFHNKY